MASSVASERAFSAAGITISKHRNRLDADIVEALQCLKSLISHQDLALRPFPSLAEEEVEMDEVDLQRANQEGTSEEVVNEEAEWTFNDHADSDDDSFEVDIEVEVLDEL
jgi:hypothetical protein